MTVMMNQEKQHDDRPIGLENKVDEGFARVDQDIRELRGEISTLRSEINARLNGMERAHYAGVVAIVAALIATSVL
jgi:hypothetical protein